MFFKDFGGWTQQNSVLVSFKCTNCGNITDHYVYVSQYYIQLELARV